MVHFCKANCGKHASFNYPGIKPPLYCAKDKLEGMENVMRRRCLLCDKCPAFNTPDKKTGIYCVKHKLPGMINVRQPHCLRCGTTPSFNHKGQKPGIYCAEHKLPGMVDVQHAICISEGCPTRANFNNPGETHPLYCAEHKLLDMVSTSKSGKCLSCGKEANFGSKGTTKAPYCKDHKEPDMVDVRHPMCKGQGCDKRASQNFEGKTPPEYCAKCALSGMIDVVTKRCEFPGCPITCAFDFGGESKGKYCLKHAEEGMVNVKSRRCDHPGCPIRPCFNIPGEHTGIYCDKHKLPGMVNVTDDKCLAGCGITANYNFKGETKGVYCMKDKLPGMIDIRHKICESPDCPIRASFGKLFGPVVHCATHATPNESSKNNPKCLQDDCPNRPLYTDQQNNYPLRCETHKTPNDKNVIERPCKNCSLPDFINETTLLCNDCNDYIVKKVHKAKENKYRNLLISHGFIPISSDRPIQGGCTKLRPDDVFDHVTYALIWETDEDQHKSYACDCEMARMCMIHQDFGGMPVIFIRFNPDSYKVGDKVIRETKSRERVVIDLMKSFNNVKQINYPLVVCYLYYDGFDGNLHFYAIDYVNGVSKEVTDIFT